MDIKDGAELVEGRMTFLQDFLQKKYAWGIVFFTLIVLAVLASVWSHKDGVETGKQNSKEQVISLSAALRSTKINDSIEILAFKNNANYYKKMYDSCNRFSASQNLNDMVLKKIEEAESLKRMIERKISEDKKFNQKIDNALKQ